jgi:2-amino-4-hydroxy-6-hydroxymethyldihydropteridine diphosphokinase
MNSNIVFIALGTNLGNREENIKKAILKVGELPQTLIAATSSIIDTKPIGKTNQPDFLNCVIKIKTSFTPEELLYELQKIEKEMGRIRKEKWGPRIIDLDILFFNDNIIETEKLTIPHPEILNRKFVLQLMNEIAPEFVHPIEKKTIEQLYAELNRSK